MKVLVCGSTGCIGRAVVHALQSRGHRVVGAARTSGLRIDYMAPVEPQAWAERLRVAQIDAVVNCVGILLPRQGQGQRFERVHAQGPAELFRGAALAGVQRVVQISALGAADGDTPYLRSKREADDTLLALPLAGTVLRPSLVYGPGSQSGALFATLAALPVVALPAGGTQRLRPIHVYEVAEIVARCLEAETAAKGAFEIGGGELLNYRGMLATYRGALGLAAPIWLPLPMALMRPLAWAAEALPQQVYCRETLRLLARGSVPAHNAAGALLGRAPTGLAAGLAISPPVPRLDLRAELSPALSALLRSALAVMWLWTATVSALWPQGSGVLALLARCGFAGDTGVLMLVLSCTLNAGLGVLTLLRPGPRLFAVQSAAIVGYTAMAAWFVPELTLDHCAPLMKNLPLLATVLVLWLARPTAQRPAQRRGAAYNTAGCR